MSGRRVIVFDSVCVLCSRWLRIVLRYDKRALYQFAAMQGDAGQALLREHGMDPRDPSSFLLLEEGIAYSDSEAVIRVLTSFGGLWRLAGAFRLVPARMRDAAYRMLARNRYRWFGKRVQCMVPPVELRTRFLD